MKPLFIFPVIEQNIKAARHTDHKLMQILVRMFAAIRSTRDIIKIVDSLDIKWDVIAALNKS